MPAKSSTDLCLGAASAVQSSVDDETLLALLQQAIEEKQPAGGMTTAEDSEPESDEDEQAVVSLEPRRACHGAQCAYDALIQEYGKRFDLEPALIKAMIRVESSFDPEAVSPKGARGLMQLMPRIARRHGARDVHDPRQNILAGVSHFRTLLDHYRQNLDLALAAYNAGSRAVKKYGGLPPYEETRVYVARVKRYREKYRQQLPPPNRFQET